MFSLPSICYQLALLGQPPRDFHVPKIDLEPKWLKMTFPDCVLILTFSGLFRKTLRREVPVSLLPIPLKMRFRQDCIKIPGEIGSCCPLSEPAEFSPRGAVK